MLYNLACNLITEYYFFSTLPQKEHQLQFRNIIFLPDFKFLYCTNQNERNLHPKYLKNPSVVPQQDSWLQLHFYRKRTEGKEDAPGKKVIESTWMGCTLTFLSCSFSDLSVPLALSSLFIIDFMRILVAQGRSREKTASEIVLLWHALNQDMLCLELQLFSC